MLDTQQNGMKPRRNHTEKLYLTFILQSSLLQFENRKLLLWLMAYASEAHLEPYQPSKRERFAEIINSLQSLTIVAKQLHHNCLTEFQLRLCGTMMK